MKNRNSVHSKFRQLLHLQKVFKLQIFTGAYSKNVSHFYLFLFFQICQANAIVHHHLTFRHRRCYYFFNYKVNLLLETKNYTYFFDQKNGFQDFQISAKEEDSLDKLLSTFQKKIKIHPFYLAHSNVHIIIMKAFFFECECAILHFLLDACRHQEQELKAYCYIMSLISRIQFYLQRRQVILNILDDHSKLYSKSLKKQPYYYFFSFYLQEDLKHSFLKSISQGYPKVIYWHGEQFS
ncbi:transmembrane protein, putative (macronuclear) [Tetrahymena thermophila SB210]|uniref:Transmembrane protein, putative n=1 Tax=Tetrahymena thermophila (strain SB210) TaxID=312017 RepID=W7XGV2_TETTS|nr:transmembrane protein, putative [Tetrahymena thermophila SB210]EWS73471.1 transmembrane protein, putative [Tetrahymena thermophila SB210]|eukprot:XP_012653953.1 transmembrane protein, putative [Tetrahymena thermophila SB210]